MYQTMGQPYSTVPTKCGSLQQPSPPTPPAHEPLNAVVNDALAQLCIVQSRLDELQNAIFGVETVGQDPTDKPERMTPVLDATFQIRSHAMAINSRLEELLQRIK